MMAGPKSVVAFEADDHPNLSRNLQRDLEAARAAQVEGFTSAKDWPDFQKRRGTVDGLDLAISLCQKAQEKLKA